MQNSELEDRIGQKFSKVGMIKTFMSYVQRVQRLQKWSPLAITFSSDVKTYLAFV